MNSDLAAATARSIFLAAPFAGIIDQTLGYVEKDHPVRKEIAEMSAILLQNGYMVFSAHQREHWGKKLFTPHDAVRVDVEWLRLADALVADIGFPPSPGVQFELGFFFASNKPILIWSPAPELLPYLTRRLQQNANVSFLALSDGGSLPQAVLDWCEGTLPACP